MRGRRRTSGRTRSTQDGEEDVDDDDRGGWCPKVTHGTVGGPLRGERLKKRRNERIGVQKSRRVLVCPLEKESNPLSLCVDTVSEGGTPPVLRVRSGPPHRVRALTS